MDFIVIRINGSHHRPLHSDGRLTTVPIHADKDLPKELLCKIIRDDLEIEFDEFVNFIC